MISRNIGVTYQAGTVIPNVINSADIPVVIGRTNNETEEKRPVDGSLILKYASYDDAKKPIADGGIGTYEIPTSEITVFVHDEGDTNYSRATITFKNIEEPSETYTLNYKSESESYKGIIPFGKYEVNVVGDFDLYAANLEVKNSIITILYDITRVTSVRLDVKGSPVTYPATIQVLDNDDEPLQYAVVNIGDDVVSTDAGGNAVFNNLEVGDHVVYVLAENKQPASKTITITYKGVQETIKLTQDTLTHKASITVNNGEGTAISGATVNLEGITNVHTDSEGNAEINHLPAGTYNLKVTAAGYTESTDTIKIESIDVYKTMILTPVSSAALRRAEKLTTDADDNVPIVGAIVTLNGNPLTEDSDGHYVINKYPHENATLKITKDGYKTASTIIQIKGGDYTQNIIMKTTAESEEPVFENPNISENKYGTVNMTSITPRGEPEPVLKPNPLLERLEEYFAENVPRENTDLQTPYVYVIDLGNADTEEAWLTAFNKSKSVPEAFWEIYVGAESVSGKDAIVSLMNKASQILIEQEHNLILREGICITPDGTTDAEHIKYCLSSIPHITFVEEKKKGAVACNRILTCPLDREPGSLDVKTLTRDEIKLRSPDEIKKLYFNGATFIISERNTREEHIRINLAVTSEWNNQDYPPRSVLQATRIYNALLREVFTELQEYIKQNETEIYISMAQSIVNTIVERYANNNLVRLFSSENPDGSKLEISEDDKEEDGLLLSGNIQPVSTIKSIKVYSTLTKRTLQQY